MSNARQKSKKMSRQQWASIVDRYYDGEDPYVLANDMRSDPSLIFDHIKKDRRSRSRKGLPPRTRKEVNPKDKTLYIEDTHKQLESSVIGDENMEDEEVKVEVEETEVLEEAEQIVEEVTVKKKHRGGKKIDLPDNFIEVLEAYESKELKTVAVAADKLGVSPATFSKWRTEYKNSLKVQAESNEQIEQFLEKKEGSNASSLVGEDRLSTTVVFEDKPVVEAGMVADRHDMPVDKYIFNSSLDNSMLWDYEAQDRVVEEFLRKEVGIEEDPLTGEPTAKSDLVVYATGIQCCICSIFKMCATYNVNLTVKHYQASRGIYKPQVVISGKKLGIEDIFKCNKLEVLGCTIDDILNSKDEYYAIKKMSYDDDGKCTRISEIVSPYLNLINDKCFSMIPDIIMNRDTKIRLCINKVKIINGKERELDRTFDAKNKE